MTRGDAMTSLLKRGFRNWWFRSRLVGGVVSWVYAGHLRRLPSLPRLATTNSKTGPPLGTRPLEIPDVPASLEGAPGIPRDSDAEARAAAESPLAVWGDVYPDAIALIRRGLMWAVLPTLPARQRLQHDIVRAAQKQTESESGHRSRTAIHGNSLSEAELTRAVKDLAAGLGLSAVGIAEYDPRYTFAPYLAELRRAKRVIVCILEQNWEATQSIPSAPAERAAFDTYVSLAGLQSELTELLRSQGYWAIEGDGVGHGLSIPYAVEAGLGQLGLNGQLLTPFAGSRARIMLIHTDAPLAIDEPVDFGVPALCDACKACVRRCPSGAITAVRKFHRGAYKAKIKSERCVPMVIQAHGCGVCMKVCPVQRFGLPAVLEEYALTGKVKGTGSDELEGYDWPPDGRHYPPGEKPKAAVGRSMLEPFGYKHDPGRQPPLATKITGATDET
jgi:epoxyqueuosine reductase